MPAESVSNHIKTLCNMHKLEEIVESTKPRGCCMYSIEEDIMYIE